MPPVSVPPTQRKNQGAQRIQLTSPKSQITFRRFFEHCDEDAEKSTAQGAKAWGSMNGHVRAIPPWSNEPYSSVALGLLLILERKRVRRVFKRPDLLSGDRGPYFCVLGHPNGLTRLLEGLSFDSLFALPRLNLPELDQRILSASQNAARLDPPVSRGSA